jgi:hypothetical protein
VIRQLRGVPVGPEKVVVKVVAWATTLATEIAYNGRNCCKTCGHSNIFYNNFWLRWLLERHYRANFMAHPQIRPQIESAG